MRTEHGTLSSAILTLKTITDFTHIGPVRKTSCFILTACFFVDQDFFGNRNFSTSFGNQVRPAWPLSHIAMRTRRNVFVQAKILFLD